MRKIVQDWMRFCEGNMFFEDSYFYTLFMDDISIEEIENIYKYFPNSDRLISRMRQYLFEEKPVIDGNNKKDFFDSLIRLDFEERRPILERLHNFSKFNSNPTFIYTDNLETVSDFILDDIWIQDFHDYMRDQMIIDDDRIWELKSALYGRTHDFDYQLFLIQPLLKTDYTMEHLYMFKKMGGVYAITNNGVVYSFKK